jgi:hypothetical protein
MTQLLTAVFWEFLQNLFMLCSFVTGVWSWKQQKRLISVTCMALTGIGGPIFMHYTEPMISGTSSLSESALEASLISNIVFFSLVAAIYSTNMAAEWSRWTTDVVFATTIALIMVATQWVASQISWQRILFHAIALGVAFPLCTVSLRVIIDKSTNLKTALFTTALVTVAISILIALIDYAPFFGQ